MTSPSDCVYEALFEDVSVYSSRLEVECLRTFYPEVMIHDYLPERNRQDEEGKEGLEGNFFLLFLFEEAKLHFNYSQINVYRESGGFL